MCAVKRFLFSDRLRGREAAGGHIFFDSSPRGSLPQTGAQQKSLLCTLPCGSIAGDSNYADGMVTVLYRCPNTGFRVQGYPAEEESVDHDGHVPVTCLACKFVHLVNPKTGEVLGQTRPPTE